MERPRGLAGKSNHSSGKGMAETIITCAVTGNITTRDHHPQLPVTPEEIAKASLDAASEGASIIHIHVRDPKTGTPSMELGLYREVVRLVRAQNPEVLINLTTGPGGRFLPSDDDPKIAAPGSSLTTPERRVEHIVELRPDICSLDFNTMYSGSSVVINTPRNLQKMADAILRSGTKPEYEVFDSGDIHLVKDMMSQGKLPFEPPLFQIVLGVKYGAVATPETLFYMRSLLPEGAVWAAFGLGRMAFPMVAQSLLLGGHVRVGLEDNVYLEKGILAPDNAALVKKAARIVRDLGGQIATPRDARRILKMAEHGQ
jgi:3-dehydrocarnitine:acetyl-CoA trimethylamine transferase